MRKWLALALLVLVSLGLVVLVAGDRDGPRSNGSPLGAEAQAAERGTHAGEPTVPRSLTTSDAGEELVQASGSSRAARREAKSAYEQELEDALWVEGRVLYPPGTPADEECLVVADGRKFEHGDDYRVLAGPDGRFRVAFSKKTKKGRLRLDTHYLMFQGSVHVDPRAESHGITLEPSLGGRVVVRFEPTPGEGIRASEVEGLLSVSRPEGEWVQRRIQVSGELMGSLDALPEGRYEARFQGSRFLDYEDGDVVVVAGQTTEITIPLSRGRTVAGIVVDEAGTPVPRARLELTVRSADHWISGSDAATDENGRFDLAGIEPGELSLAVKAPGFVPTSVDVTEPEPAGPRAELRIVLSRGASIRGTVVDAAGEPAPGVWIDSSSSDPTDSHGMLEQRVQSAEDGTFELSGLGEEAVTLTATITRKTKVEVVDPLTGKVCRKTKRIRERGIAQDVLPGTTGLVLRIGTGQRLEGVVVDSRGAPVTLFHLHLEVRSESNRAPVEVLDQDVADPNGSFSLEGLPAGVLLLTASARGFGTSDPIGIRLPGDEAPLRIELGRIGTVSGVVVSPDGVPIAGAAVTAGSGELWDDDRGVTGDTKADGSFVLEGVPPGKVALTARAVGYAASTSVAVQVEPGEQAGGVELRLRRAARIEGEVRRLDGSPDPHVAVNLQVFDDGDLKSTRTDEDGTFRFEDLAPGFVGVSAPPSPEDVAAVFGEGAGPSAAQLLARRMDFELAEGETARVLLEPSDVDPVSVHGTVTLNGEPLVGARVSARVKDGIHDEQSTDEADEQGAYRVILPSGGPSTFWVSDPDWGCGFQTTVAVPAVDDWQHDLAYETGSIEGTVRASDGKPLVGIDIQAGMPQHEEDALFCWAQAVTGEDGRYRLPYLAAGVYEVSAGDSQELAPSEGESAGSLYAAAKQQDMLVTARGAVKGVDFELSEGARLEGTVRFEGEPVTNSWVTVVDAAGGLHGAGLSDRTGAFASGGLPPGEVSVFAADAAQHGSPPVSLTLEAGKSSHVDLELVPTGTLVVVLLGPGGEPARGEVHVEGGYDPWLHFLEDQTWQLAGAPVGELRVLATLHGVQQTATAQIRGGETQRVELSFP